MTAIESTETKRRTAQLAQTAQVIALALERRANTHSGYLRAGAAIFATQPVVPATLFQAYATQIRLDADYRGAEGIGWAMRADRADIDAVEKGMRATAKRDFTIRPRPTDDQAYAVTVMYFQPETERNRRVLGYNMYAERARRIAMQEAQRHARPTATGKTELFQGQRRDGPVGFLIYMPVFAPGADGRRQLKGFVYSPFDSRQFLLSALELDAPTDVGIHLYDRVPAAGNLLARRPIPNPSGRIVRQRVTIANHPLMLVVESPTPSTLTNMSLLTLLFGMLVASLLLVLARLVTRQASEDRLALAWLGEQASIRNSLTRELNHRVKNTLANVLSIVSLTRRRATDLDSFSTSLEGRIRALSATHDLLTQSEWGTTPIRAVITAELAPYVLDSEKFLDLSGPDVQLAPNDALSLGLAIHELATNAAKYGSLSVVGGRVAVTWKLMTQDLARVEWIEMGGPPVPAERKRGFGTELIEKIVAHELQNPVELSFEPEGVRCTLIIPVRRPSAFAMRAER
ncbi:MAG: CHASE domain-containing protein [Novosphingobium sp.]